MRISKVLLIVLIIISFPLAGGYVVWTDNQQNYELCQESQQRHDVIYDILSLFKARARDPKRLEAYFDVLGTRPTC